MAANTTLRWIGEKHFIGVDSTRHSVVLSGQSDGIGVKPSEMLLIALSACSSVDVVQILEKKRIALTFMEVLASAEQDPDPPWTFRKIHLIYRVSGKGLTAKALEQAINLSQDKYCSVATTLRGVAQVVTEYVILPESGTGKD